MSSGEASRKAVQGASLLILLQVVSRAITFIANQVLLRFLTAQLLGVSTQLEVYYLSVIFFARESLRVAIQRQDSSSSSVARDKKNDDVTPNRSSSTQAVVNLGYLAIALGIPLAAGFGWLYLQSLTAETLASTPYLVISLYIYALAAVLELVSEPAFVVMQTRLQFGTRATAESVATFLRCIVTLGSAMFGAAAPGAISNPRHQKSGTGTDSLELGVLPFALGQLSYGVGLLAVYTWYGAGLAFREGFSLLPKRLTTTTTTTTEYALSFFYRPTLQLASSMMAQSVVKHILTQGDTFLVSVLSTPTAQGVYALANNYGGLVARLVFQPIEESSRTYFSKLLAPPSSSSTSSSSHHTKSATGKASSNLSSILKIYLLLSLIIVTLGPTASPLLLSLVAGSRWASSGAADTLAIYTLYIPLLAINGIAEAFVASVATETEVHAQSAWMTAFSLIFGLSGFVFLRILNLGAIGLVLANGINMLCRIVWCTIFISRYFKRHGGNLDLLGVLPSPVAVVAAAVTTQMVRKVPELVARAGILERTASPIGAKHALVQLVGMAVVALPFIGILLFSERQFLLQGYKSLVKR
ncbi:Rft protein-domain-containing protein [Apodospora peruviana]|uniref:Man(5)GlcNAc(2)-PP-dolichol translocation protein RFT1 n=1 Tax=Apodospora peruviana TaxID=516989 RepID=A0AAE0I2D7_9PEZI|nr:Rft protein-domain-containing protein [Apodospora peruviana]